MDIRERCKKLRPTYDPDAASARAASRLTANPIVATMPAASRWICSAGQWCPWRKCDGETDPGRCRGFTGSEQVYRHSLMRNVVYTEDVNLLESGQDV